MIWKKRTRAIALVGVPLSLGAVEAAQSYVGAAAQGMDMTLQQAALATLPSWVILTALLPIVIAACNRFPPQRDPRRHVPLHLIFAVLFALCHLGGTAILYNWIPGYPSSTAGFTVLFSFYFAVELVTYGMIVAACSAVQSFRQFQERSLYAAELRRQLAETRIERLRAQINPHFLFNSLNAVSSLAMRGDRIRVVHTLSSLGELLRYSMDEDLGPFVSVHSEVRLLERYFSIQHLRFGDRLVAVVHTDTDTHSLRLPSLLLQTLADDVLAAGLPAGDAPVEVAVRLRRDDGRLEITVSDNLSRGTNTAGVMRARARLIDAYGGALDFHTESASTGRRVLIRLPAQEDALLQRVP